MSQKTKKQRKSHRRQIRTRKDAEGVVSDINALVIERNSLLSEISSLRRQASEMLAPQVAALAELTEPEIERVEAWAKEHREEFGEARSIETPDAVFGWRRCNPRVVATRKLKPGKEVSKVFATLGASYVRAVEEIDRQAILRDYRNGLLTDRDLRKAGLRVTQADRFFVKSKSLPGRNTVYRSV